MLDRIDAGPHRLLYPCRPVGMGGDLTAEPVRLHYYRSYFVVTELLRAWRVALGQHPTSRRYLYAVRAVLDYFAGLGYDRGHSIGHAFSAIVHLGCKQADISMAACRPY